MTWTPRNRSEDEEEEENIDLEKNDEDEPQKPEDKGDLEGPEAGWWMRGKGVLRGTRKAKGAWRGRARVPASAGRNPGPAAWPPRL